MREVVLSSCSELLDLMERGASGLYRRAEFLRKAAEVEALCTVYKNSKRKIPSRPVWCAPPGAYLGSNGSRTRRRQIY